MAGFTNLCECFYDYAKLSESTQKSFASGI